MKTQSPKVSIIIPVYNSCKYIIETLESALNQTYQNVECIVIDDGSTDNIDAVLKPYSKYITLIKKQNGGPASARNAGIKIASGKYIAFLDSDDLWRPKKLSKQIDFLEKHPNAGFIHTDSIGFSRDPKKVDRHFVCNIEGNVFKNLFWSNYIINSSTVVRQSCINKIGLLDENPHLVGSEDYDYWLRLSLKNKLAVIHEPLTLYRLRADSLIGESYNKAFKLHVLIYRKSYRDIQDLKAILGLSQNQALFDLYIRYAFQNLIKNQVSKGVRKSLSSMRFSPFKGLLATALIVSKRPNDTGWTKLINNWSLWRNIVGAEQ